MNEMYLVLGDPSNDGHGQYDKLLVKVNKTVDEVQEAYKASYKLTGISYNHNNDYTETNRNWRIGRIYQIAAEYENSEISDEIYEVLQKFAYPHLNVDHFSFLWWWFVGLSLSDLEYSEVNLKAPQNINDINFNVQFGMDYFKFNFINI